MNAIKICKRSTGENLENRIKSLEEKINNIKSFGNNAVVSYSHSDNNLNNTIEDNRSTDEYNQNMDYNKNLDLSYKSLNQDNSSFDANKSTVPNNKNTKTSSIEKSRQSAIINDGNNTSENMNNTNQDISLERIKSDWRKIIKELISRGAKGYAGFVEHARPEKFHDNILELVFDEKDSLFYDYCVRPDNKNILRDLINNVYNTNIDVRMKLKKNGVDKLEDIFGKNNIEDI